MENSNNTLFHNSIREKGSQSAKRSKADDHNIARRRTNNFKEELTKNNYLEVLNNIIDCSNQDEMNKAFNESQKFIEDQKKKFIKDNSGNNQRLKEQRKKAKYKLSQWIENKKNTKEEIEFYKNLHSKIGIEEITNNDIEGFQKLEGIKRAGQKLKVVNDLMKFNKILNSQSTNLELKIVSMEHLFKVPDDNNLTIKKNDWIDYVDNFYKKNFPDYKVIYKTVHLDENPKNPHIHSRISGYNEKTKTYDLPDKEIEFLSNRMSKYPFKGRSWASLDTAEQKEHGQFYQEYIFKSLNTFLNKRGYEVNFQKTREVLGEEHVLNDNEKELSIDKRQFNNKALDKEKKQEARIEALEKSVNGLKSELEHKNKDVIMKEKNLEKLKAIAKKQIREKNQEIKKTNEDLENEKRKVINKDDYIDKQHTKNVELKKENKTLKDKVEEFKNEISDYKKSFKAIFQYFNVNTINEVVDFCREVLEKRKQNEDNLVKEFYQKITNQELPKINDGKELVYDEHDLEQQHKMNVERQQRDLLIKERKKARKFLREEAQKRKEKSILQEQVIISNKSNHKPKRPKI